MKVEAPREVGATVSATTSSAQSAVLDGRDLVISSDVAFHILFGSNPTATTACLRIPANTAVPFSNIVPGEKFAVILTTGTGTVQYSAVG
ncbi:MAG: hypothetical protein RL268_286 [Pseudomonadota bacterium]|jgi:hypothetical protein